MSSPADHVADSKLIELPQFVLQALNVPEGAHGLELPAIAGFQLTKFMLLQVVAGLLTWVIFRGLASHISGGRAARGWFWNLWEMAAVYIRDNVVRPTIGAGHDHHDEHHGDGHHGHASHAADPGHPADGYLPLVWTIFFYVLFCNLLGAIPFLGSATANTSVTGALALCVFITVLYTGMKKSGVVGYWASMVPPMDVPPAMAIVLKPMIWIIEVVGLFIKHIVLAVRLFANMFGGHLAVAVLLGFIADSASYGALWYAVTPLSIAGQVGLGLLELLVAVLQAYVFSLLTCVFIGASLHGH